MYLCYDVNMWSIYGIDIRLLKEHPEYKEQIKLLPTRWEKVNKIKKGRHFRRFFISENSGINEKMLLYVRASVWCICAWCIIPVDHFPKYKELFRKSAC